MVAFIGALSFETVATVLRLFDVSVYPTAARKGVASVVVGIFGSCGCSGWRMEASSFQVMA